MIKILKPQHYRQIMIDLYLHLTAIICLLFLLEVTFAQSRTFLIFLTLSPLASIFCQSHNPLSMPVSQLPLIINREDLLLSAHSKPMDPYVKFYRVILPTATSLKQLGGTPAD